MGKERGTRPPKEETIGKSAEELIGWEQMDEGGGMRNLGKSRSGEKRKGGVYGD